MRPQLRSQEEIGPPYFVDISFPPTHRRLNVPPQCHDLQVRSQIALAGRVRRGTSSIEIADASFADTAK
jgi:hypothetical protein